MKIIDITKPIFQGMRKYPTDPCVRIASCKSLKRGDSCNLAEISFGSHTGTHIDTPLHMLEDGIPVDKIPAENFILKAVVTDLDGFERDGFERMLIKKRVKAVLFKGLNGKIGLSEKEALSIIRIKARVIGTELLTVDSPSSPGHPVHKMLLKKNIFILENIDLTKTNRGYYTLLCMPLKIKGGDGSPVRAVLLQ